MESRWDLNDPPTSKDIPLILYLVVCNGSSLRAVLLNCLGEILISTDIFHIVSQIEETEGILTWVTVLTGKQFPIDYIGRSFIERVSLFQYALRLYPVTNEVSSLVNCYTTSI